MKQSNIVLKQSVLQVVLPAYRVWPCLWYLFQLKDTCMSWMVCRKALLTWAHVIKTTDGMLQNLY